MNNCLSEIVGFLKSVNEIEQARQLLLTFAKHSNTIDQFNEIGMLFDYIKAYNETIDILKICQSMCTNIQQQYAIFTNFAKCYNQINDPNNALHYSNLCLQQIPTDNNIKLEQSLSYYMLGDYKKSQEIQNLILQDKNISNNVQSRINFNMGIFDLSAGLFNQGMKKIITGGKESGIWPTITKPYKRWDGLFTTKIILIYAEAGIGDQILHLRFAKEIERRGMNYIWVGANPITEVFKNNNYTAVLNDSSFNNFENYVYCESSTLSVLLNIEQEELYTSPYLHADTEYIDKWRKILPNKFISIKWRGNPEYEQDAQRTLPVSNLINLIKTVFPEMPLVSLQLDGCDTIPGVITVNIESWEDTLAIQHLSLMNISSCTSTAHSAGAIGANCIVLPPTCKYYPWVYLKDDHSSYWYGPNLKVFPQQCWNEWSGPFSLLAAELKKL